MNCGFQGPWFRIPHVKISRILDYFTCGDSDNIFLFQQLDMPMQWKEQALETVSWRNRKRRRCSGSIQFCCNSGSTCCFLLVRFNITIVKKLTHNLSCELNFGNHGKCSFVGRGVSPIGFPSLLRTRRWKSLGSIFDWTNTQLTQVLTEIIDEECVACL